MHNRIRQFGLGTMLALAPLAAVAQPAQPAPTPGEGYYWRSGPWHMMGYDGYGWHGWWRFPTMLIFVIVALAAMFFLFRTMSHGPRRHGASDWEDPTLPALRILNERFARGEIERAEFEEKKAALLFGGRR